MPEARALPDSPRKMCIRDRSYRAEVATEAWGEIWKFYGRHLSDKK